MTKELINKLSNIKNDNLDEQNTEIDLFEELNQNLNMLIEENIAEKCQLIMIKLEDIIELSSQINHNELFNIMLTIYDALINLYDDETSLDKILAACEETYIDMHPKEMKRTLN